MLSAKQVQTKILNALMESVCNMMMYSRYRRYKRYSYYLAYGSNLSVEQMALRCPDAEVVGKAMLKGWKLKFKFHATIEPCKGSTVPVLIWKISEDDEKNLDSYESFPHYYIKQKLKVLMTDLDGEHKKKITGMVYVMTDGSNESNESMPPESYYEIISDGYRSFGFDENILNDALLEATQAEQQRMQRMEK